jgi:hypothetical protein
VALYTPQEYRPWLGLARVALSRKRRRLAVGNAAGLLSVALLVVEFGPTTGTAWDITSLTLFSL